MSRLVQLGDVIVDADRIIRCDTGPSGRVMIHLEDSWIALPEGVTMNRLSDGLGIQTGWKQDGQ